MRGDAEIRQYAEKRCGRAVANPPTFQTVKLTAPLAAPTERHRRRRGSRKGTDGSPARACQPVSAAACEPARYRADAALATAALQHLNRAPFRANSTRFGLDHLTHEQVVGATVGLTGGNRAWGPVTRG
jgi:hypothetical protein